MNYQAELFRMQKWHVAEASIIREDLEYPAFTPLERRRKTREAAMHDRFARALNPFVSGYSSRRSQTQADALVAPKSNGGGLVAPKSDGGGSRS